MRHYGFEMSAGRFREQTAWPAAGSRPMVWQGAYASQSPLNAFYVTNEGGGAEGTRGYLALPGANADQFYAEVTPHWHRPRECWDLRNTRASLYLKAVSPITVRPGYFPYLFIDDYDADSDSYCGWYVHEPLKVGSDWTLNVVDLVDDEARWVRYSRDRSLGHVLGHVGFIGVMYLKGASFTGVNACGVLGIDEFKVGIPFS